jgi:hypothetical protein
MFASLEDVSHTVFPRAKTVNSKNPLRFPSAAGFA